LSSFDNIVEWLVVSSVPYVLAKDTEYRFNHRRDNLYLELLQLLRLNPL